MIKTTFQSSRSFSIAKGFELIDSVTANDLNINISRYHHRPSGAFVYHLLNDDPNNCFSPVVKTLPQNDKGCPHILEHLACCGSKKYPIRDPFFNMLKRSVNTYMNAWTGGDFTAYPFSSANKKDFDNLYHVYLDMTLKPSLNELDFRQEGWRHQINEEGVKQLKGIVLNQMKGAYQNPQRQLAIEISKNLFKGTAHQYDSGGKPEQIVKLSYEQVRNMHEYYYHPSNISFFFYGNSNITEKLQYLSETYLSSYNNTELKYKQAPFDFQANLGSTDIYSPNAQCNSVSINYYLGHIHHIQEVESMCLKILSYVLLDNNQALVYKGFVEQGLADSLGSSGYWIDTLSTFNISLKGIKAENKGEFFNQKLQKMLTKLMEDGISEQRIAEFAHQTQIELLLPKTNNGIHLLGTSIPFLNNRIQLNNLLNTREKLKKAISLMTDKQFLSYLVNKYLLKNKNKVIIRQLRSENASEGEQLKGLEMKDELIKKQQQELMKRQNEEDPSMINCLPKILLSDLHEGKQKSYNIISKSQNVTHYHVEMKENIHYLRFLFALEDVSADVLSALGLWAYTINKGISTKSLSHEELSSKLNRVSGNFRVTIVKGENEEIIVSFSASCLSENVDEFVSLLKEMLVNPKFEKENSQNIFRSFKSQITEKLLDTPMNECLDHCGSFITKKGRIFNSYLSMTSGLKLAHQMKVPSQFQKIHQNLLQNSKVRIIQHSPIPTASIFQSIMKNNQYKKQSRKSEISKLQGNFMAITHNYQVNFCCQAYPSPPNLTEEDAYLQLFLQILSQDYLHPKIREKGGAYGAKALIRQNNTVVLYSYMDPNSDATFEAFDESIQELLNGEISENQLSEAKIKNIGQLDKPIIPQNECYNEIMKGHTKEKIKKYREWVLKATKENLKQVGRKYLKKELKHCMVFGKDVPANFQNVQLDIIKQ